MRILIAVLAVAVSVPVVSIPTSPEAQVLAGRNAARAARPRPSREDRLSGLLADAQDRLAEIEDEIAEIEGVGQTAGALTSGQQRQLTSLNQRREREQREIARLEEALGS